MAKTAPPLPRTARSAEARHVVHTPLRVTTRSAPLATEPPGTAALPLQPERAALPTRSAPERSSAWDADSTLSPAAQSALALVVAGDDNGAAPFIIIDKRRARLWVFDAQARPRGSTPVLLGLARGDHTVPGVGNKPLTDVKRDERTTPAGRFVGEHGRNLNGDDIIWVDYDAAVSMHRVKDVHATDRREQRLQTRSIADNRISYGCINIPKAFYDHTLLPLVGRARPVVYVLPESRPVQSIFKSGRPDLMAHRSTE